MTFKFIIREDRQWEKGKIKFILNLNMVSLRFFTKILIIFATVSFACGRSCLNQLERAEKKLESSHKMTHAVKKLERFLNNWTSCNEKETFLNQCKPKLTSVLIHLPVIKGNEFLLDNLLNTYSEELFAAICSK